MTEKKELRSSLSHFYLGLDLGQSKDYSALAVVEHVEHEWMVEEEETTERGLDYEYEYKLRFLKRYPKMTPYPEVVRNVKGIMQGGRFGEDPVLVVDATGVGQAVVDLFVDEALDPLAIKIHGGDKVKRDGMNINVPKRDLVGALMVIFQNGELEIAKSLPEAHTLMTELQNFKVKISTRGHDSYEAWREGQHDDLVLALAMACWMIKDGEVAPTARWI
jgi:hypothetical protein